mgnify:CR=1 FL=1
MTTTSINDITVDLNNLYNAYNAVLEQAKAQLESMEISDQHIDRIASSLLDRSYLTGLIADRVIDKLNQRPIDDLLDDNRFVGRVANRVSTNNYEEVKDHITRHVSSDDFKYQLERLISQRAVADESLNSPVNILLRQRLRNALKYAFSSEAVDEAFSELENSETA